MDARVRYLSPAEAAKRLGVSGKALRLYEHHGLVTPLRTAANWRTFGPGQMTRLHQILALKRMGLPLAKIGELLNGRASTLASVLVLQEQVLADEEARVGHALALVRAARARLAKGETLSIDDLATLTKETTMSAKPSQDELKKLFDPIIAKHFSEDDLAAIRQRKSATQDRWDELIAEAKSLVAKGEDPASPVSRDLAKRWAAQVQEFTGGVPEFEQRAGAVWKDVLADPDAANKLPLNREIFEFVVKAQAAAKGSE